MTRLKSIAGRLLRRSPGFGMIPKEKILYIDYKKLIQPIRINDRDIPAPQEEMIKHFKSMVVEYGINIDSLKDWSLFIDARDDYWMPHQEIPLALQKLYTLFDPKNICILSNSVYDASELPHCVEFYPTDAANIYGYYDQLYEQSINWDEIALDKHFIALARRPSIMRVSFIKSMLDQFGDSIRASCGSRIRAARRVVFVPYPKDINGISPVKENISQPKPLPTEDLYKSYVQLMHPYPYPLTIDGDLINDVQQHQNFDSRFFSAIVNVICETMDKDDQPINLSEKTFKAFAWRQIPIWHASPGTVAEVRYLGFDLFDDIIDHGYDSCRTYAERKDAILNSMSSFYRQFPTITDITKLRQQIKERLEFNDKLLQEIITVYRPLVHENLFK